MARKRSNGEGSIRREKTDAGKDDIPQGMTQRRGKAIYKNVLGKPQEEVKEKLKQAIGETKALEVTKAGKYTAGEWMEVWFQDYDKIKVRFSLVARSQMVILKRRNPELPIDLIVWDF